MKIVLSFVLMIGLTVTANLLLKLGADEIASAPGIWQKLQSWRVLLGFVAFGSAAIVYVIILGWLPLNVAQSFAAAQFIAVILASHWILSEPIGVAQWAGIALIASGIAIVGISRG